MGDVRSVDATGDEARPPLHPEVVEALRSAGHVEIGRVASVARPTIGDAGAFDRGQRARLDQWRRRPPWTLLAHTDGTSYASVGSFGDGPLVRQRTVLADGSLVETIGLSPEGGLLPRSGDPLESHRQQDADGRSVLVLPHAAWLLLTVATLALARLAMAAFGVDTNGRALLVILLAGVTVLGAALLPFRRWSGRVHRSRRWRPAYPRRPLTAPSAP